MPYITIRQSPMYHQMTLDDLLFKSITEPATITFNIGNTKTVFVDELPDRLARATKVNRLIRRLHQFNTSTEGLRSCDRPSLYYSFSIPKKTRGWRHIDAPNPELMDALRTLKTIFESDFGALYHTSAFAYIRKRSTIDAVKRHQQNESRWFGKYDLSNFFGSTTLEFVMKQMSTIYPFSEVIKVPQGREELEKALELAFLNGGLPQGTPISPLITNIIMIPIDHRLYNALRDFETEGGKQRFIYTRYADDFIVSSRYDFSVRQIEQFLVDTLAEFGAPFALNQEKTRYGSNAGKNFNLGVMLNSDNQITIGHARKRRFQCALDSYAKSKISGDPWPREDVQVLAGQHSYYRMVEHETIDKIVAHIGGKNGLDILAAIKEDLK